jgi:hypothetical protein
MRLLLWKIPWITVAIFSLYLLVNRWQVECLTLTPVDPVATVRQLIAEDRYPDAADQVQYFLEIADDTERDHLQALAAKIETHRTSFNYQATKIIQEGLFDGGAQSDEFSAQLAGLLSSLLVIGDLRDLTREGLHWLNNEPTDEVVIALSTLGVLASASQLVTVGATSQVKTGVTVLSLAHKVGALPIWLRQHLVHLARVGWESRSLQPVVSTLNTILVLMKSAGLRSGLALLGRSRDLDGLHRIVALSKVLGPSTGPLVRIGGDTAITLVNQVETLGIHNIKRASRYGPEGIRLIQAHGVIRFIKYGVRLSKLAITYPCLGALAKWLLKLPIMLCVVGLLLGVLFGLPWSWHKRFMK